jgi:hypothetical protein
MHGMDYTVTIISFVMICLQDAHTRDGAAMARFLCWLEREMDKGTEIWEMDVCRESLKQRSKHSM